jgi:protein-tyrosine phosphatase
MPRPRAGDWLEDEVRAWRAAGVDLVVSLLTASEVAELGLVEEAKICSAHGIEFLSFPVPDRQVPASPAAAVEWAATIDGWLKQGRAAAIHCRMGIGRSALLAACVLVYQGTQVNAAFEMIGKARGTPVPDTDAQRAWVADVSDALQLHRRDNS